MAINCIAEVLKKGDSAEIVALPGSDNEFIGRRVLILKHRPHAEPDMFCVEVEHPDKPEEIVLVRAKALTWIIGTR